MGVSYHVGREANSVYDESLNGVQTVQTHNHEFTNNRNWPTQIYVREARRMSGEYVMTENDCRRLTIAKDPVGLGSYQMDSHNVQRYITKMGCVQNEGNIEVSTKEPYAISYRSIIPKK
ncbi:FAD-dependent oxidoreductase [Proteiniphilum sp.]|uniref:FAD-dependent oxidoreductase n=1 Tax=Proteiniphilum sp. TaxID=1926877 RepID=UPI0033291B13